MLARNFVDPGQARSHETLLLAPLSFLSVSYPFTLRARCSSDRSLPPPRHERIIEPLASRCSKFRFRSLDTSSTKERLETVAQAEKVAFDEPGVLDTLISTSDGDLRRAITYLQSASRLHAAGAAPVAGAATDGDGKEKGEGTGMGTAVTRASIVEIAGVVPASVVVSLARSLGVQPPIGSEDAEGDAEMEGVNEQVARAKGAERFALIKKQVEHIALEGYSGTQLLVQVSLPAGHFVRSTTRGPRSLLTITANLHYRLFFFAIAPLFLIHRLSRRHGRRNLKST